MTVPPPAVGLITAALDLQMVQLIRGAIAENNVGNHRPRVYPGATPDRVDIGPRLTIEPTPRILPRPVHHPEPAFAPRPVHLYAPPPCDEREPVPEAFGPLPAPWQMLLREKVWNRATEAPAGPIACDALAKAYSRSQARTGDLINAFL